jgi:mannitol/fructose-specific phosphotransferase system IIA component (Ntr-type)
MFSASFTCSPGTEPFANFCAGPAPVSSSVSPEGIEFPDTTRSAHFIFLLLSPAPQREQHLRLLGQISRMVHDNERLREVLQSRNVESVLEGFRTDSTRVERV